MTMKMHGREFEPLFKVMNVPFTLSRSRTNLEVDEAHTAEANLILAVAHAFFQICPDEGNFFEVARSGFPSAQKFLSRHGNHPILKRQSAMLERLYPYPRNVLTAQLANAALADYIQLHFTPEDWL